MTEGLIKKANADAEKMLAPILHTLHDTLLLVYISGFTQGLQVKDLTDEEAERMIADEECALVTLKKDAILKKMLHKDEFSARTWNVLRAMGVHTLGDMTTHTRIDYIRMRNFGKTCMREVEEYVRKYGYEIK